LRIIETVMAVNDQRKRAMARKVASVLGGDLRGRTVGVLGLTFKPNTDYMREAPSIAIITARLDMGAKVRACDPAGMEQCKPLLPNIDYAINAYACAQGAHALVIVTVVEADAAGNLLDVGAESLAQVSGEGYSRHGCAKWTTACCKVLLTILN
jgi:UDPglucose 6-dehydrogenase